VNIESVRCRGLWSLEGYGGTLMLFLSIPGGGNRGVLCTSAELRRKEYLKESEWL